jgi:aminomethyltransferase
MSETVASAGPLSRLLLHDLHVAHGAKLVPFAGYSMPVQYAAGVLKEHQHTRSSAGLFDVSHMGQAMLRPRSGRFEDAAQALERLVPADILALPHGRQRYAVFTTETGGIIDDLMVANLGDHLFLVVNAAGKAGDIAHLRTHLSDVCDVDVLEERVLVALQGPLAADALAKMSPTTVAMRFMDAGCHVLAGVPCRVSRSGYTGEDGYELSIPADRAVEIVERLLASSDVMPIGLGARDSLRLEAGLCLYDHDIDATTTPVEAALEWSIPKSRRPGGARSGRFPGADVILAQLRDGASRRRVGLSPEGRAPVRSGASVFRDDLAAEAIGQVTSGGFGPSVNRPVAMGYLPAELALPGTRVFAEVRGQRLPMSVAMLPFVPHNYKR